MRKPESILTLSIFMAVSISHSDLIFHQKVQDGFDDVDGLSGVTEGSISHDGRFLYFAAAEDRSVSAFSRDEQTGRLTFVQKLGDRMVKDSLFSSGGPIAMSPDGLHIYGVHSGYNSLNTFSRDEADGRIQRIGNTVCGAGGIKCIPDFSSISVSRNGKYLYYADPNPGAIGCLARNASDGTLSFNYEIKNDSNGVPGMDGVGRIALSDDGRNLYASSAPNHSILVFDLDQATGRLTFLHRVEQAGDDIAGLRYVGKIHLSPDGKNLYALSSWTNSICIFDRDTLTGRLSFNSAIKDSVGGVKAVNRPVSMAISPDGKSVCIGSGRLTSESVEGKVTLGENTVALYLRNPDSGKLKYVHHIASGTPGVDSLDIPYCIFFSPDGAFAYASSYSGAVNVFVISQSISIRDRDGFTSPLRNKSRRLSLVGNKILALETLETGAFSTAAGFDLTGKSISIQRPNQDAGASSKMQGKK